MSKIDTSERPIKQAATIILMRPADDGGFNIFLEKRGNAKAFSNLYVFPGGTIDSADSDSKLLSRVKGITTDEANRIFKTDSGAIEHWVAAIRETFEEAGILLAYNNSGRYLGDEDMPFAQEREALNDKSLSFNDFCEQQDLTLAADKIAYYSHWITPSIEKRRFNTRFFVASVHDSTTGAHCDVEMDDSLWLTPQQALDKNGDDFNIIFPTIMNLKGLLEFSSCDSAFQHILDNARDNGVPTITPRFVVKDGKPVTILMPGDAGYEEAQG